MQKGMEAEAEQEMREAIRLDRDNPLYHSGLAGILERNRNFGSAIAELKRAVSLEQPGTLRRKLDTHLERLDLEYGAALGESGHFEAGLALAQEAAKQYPQSEQVYEMLGYFQRKRQRNVEAAASYQRASELDRSSISALLGLGMAQYAAGMTAESKDTLENAIQRFPQEAAFHQALGVVVLNTLSNDKSEGTQQAERIFQQALQIDGTLAESHYELGSIALKRGDWEEARRHLMAAERSAPADSRIHFALARVCRHAGQTAEAEQEWEAFQEAKAKERSTAIGRMGQAER